MMKYIGSDPEAQYDKKTNKKSKQRRQRSQKKRRSPIRKNRNQTSPPSSPRETNLSIQNFEQHSTSTVSQYPSNLWKNSSGTGFRMFKPPLNQIIKNSRNNVQTASSYQEIIVLRDISQVIKLFYHKLLVIWIDTRPLPPQEIQKAYPNYEIYYAKTIQELEDFVIEHKEQDCHICIIVGSRYLQSVYRKYGKNPQIVAIYYFGNKKIPNSKDTKLIAQKSITKISSNISQQLLNFQIKFGYREMPKIGLINFEVEKSKQRSNILRKILAQPMDRTFAKKNFLDLAKQYFSHYKKDIARFEQQYSQKQLDISQAIQWYTLQSFTFKLLNMLLRSSNSQFVLNYVQLLFKDVFDSVEALSKQQKKHFQNKKKFSTFRVTELSEKEIDFFKNNKNASVELLGFISTTEQIQITTNFQGNTLIEIVVDETTNYYRIIGSSYADISNWSSNMQENEILFNALSYFEIIKFQQFSDLSQEQIMKIYKLQDSSMISTLFDRNPIPKYRIILHYGVPIKDLTNEKIHNQYLATRFITAENSTYEIQIQKIEKIDENLHRKNLELRRERLLKDINIDEEQDMQKLNKSMNDLIIMNEVLFGCKKDKMVDNFILKLHNQIIRIRKSTDFKDWEEWVSLTKTIFEIHYKIYNIKDMKKMMLYLLKVYRERFQIRYRNFPTIYDQLKNSEKMLLMNVANIQNFSPEICVKMFKRALKHSKENLQFQQILLCEIKLAYFTALSDNTKAITLKQVYQKIEKHVKICGEAFSSPLHIMYVEILIKCGKLKQGLQYSYKNHDRQMQVNEGHRKSLVQLISLSRIANVYLQSFGLYFCSLYLNIVLFNQASEKGMSEEFLNASLYQIKQIILCVQDIRTFDLLIKCISNKGKNIVLKWLANHPFFPYLFKDDPLYSQTILIGSEVFSSAQQKIEVLESFLKFLSKTNQAHPAIFEITHNQLSILKKQKHQKLQKIPDFAKISLLVQKAVEQKDQVYFTKIFYMLQFLSKQKLYSPYKSSKIRLIAYIHQLFQKNYGKITLSSSNLSFKEIGQIINPYIYITASSYQYGTLITIPPERQLQLLATILKKSSTNQQTYQYFSRLKKVQCGTSKYQEAIKRKLYDKYRIRKGFVEIEERNEEAN